MIATLEPAAVRTWYARGRVCFLETRHPQRSEIRLR